MASSYRAAAAAVGGDGVDVVVAMAVVLRILVNPLGRRNPMKLFVGFLDLVLIS